MLSSRIAARVGFCFILFVSVPVLGQSYFYEIAFDDVTDVNDFGQAFPAFQVEFIADMSQWTEQPETHAWFGNSVSSFVVRSEASVVFQANTGYLDWLGFIGDGELGVGTRDHDNALDNASLYFDLEWADLTAEGEFSNRLKEFRIPGLGGSLAWNVAGSITQIDATDIPIVDPLAAVEENPGNVVEDERTDVTPIPVDTSAPALGQLYRYEIDYNGVTDVNDFSQEFPGFQVEFISDLSQWTEQPETYAWFGNAISSFVVRSEEGDVLFQADAGDLTVSSFASFEELEVYTKGADNPLDTAQLDFDLDWADLTTEGEFTNRLKEFRIPGLGGSIAWDITGTITQVEVVGIPGPGDPVEAETVTPHATAASANFLIPEPSGFLHGILALVAYVTIGRNRALVERSERPKIGSLGACRVLPKIDPEVVRPYRTTRHYNEENIRIRHHGRSSVRLPHRLSSSRSR